jgi:hypothetical protein
MAWQQYRFDAGVAEVREMVDEQHASNDKLIEALDGQQSVSEYGLGFRDEVVRTVARRGEPIRAAKALLKHDMASEALAIVTQIEGEEIGTWIIDPDHDNVVGLVDVTDLKTAYVVVYLENLDWETSREFEMVRKGIV